MYILQVWVYSLRTWFEKFLESMKVALWKENSCNFNVIYYLFLESIVTLKK